MDDHESNPTPLLCETSSLNERVFGIGYSGNVDILTLLGYGETEETVYSITEDWHPGGSETYVQVFSINSGGENSLYIAKACVKFLPTETMEDWLNRREILSAGGVTTPDLFYAERGMLIEEFVPLSFKEAHTQANDAGKKLLEAEFLITYERVLALGFQPQSLHDIRSHGNDVVLIDFGEDLGAPLEQPPSHTAQSIAVTVLDYLLKD